MYMQIRASGQIPIYAAELYMLELCQHFAFSLSGL